MEQDKTHIIGNMIGAINDDDANNIVNEAFRRLGIRKQKDKDRLRIATAGYSESKKPREIIAYSLEKNYINKGTAFNQEIEKIIIERIKKK